MWRRKIMDKPKTACVSLNPVLLVIGLCINAWVTKDVWMGFGSCWKDEKWRRITTLSVYVQL